MTAKHPTRTKAGKALFSPAVLPPFGSAADGESLALRLTFTGVAA